MDITRDARDRLLPASIPYRFFGLAVICHVGAWGLLACYGDGLPGFIGGPGPILAALHMITLGVGASTACGAAIQLLPVASRVSLRGVGATVGIFLLLVPGLLILFHGMGAAQDLAMEIGAALVIAALGLFAWKIMDLMYRVKDMPVPPDYVWISSFALIGLLSLAGLLVADGKFGFLPRRQDIAAAHGLLAVYGFMGMLAMGFSGILLPMFTLGHPPNAIWNRRAAGLALAGLLLSVAGLLADQRTVFLIGWVLGMVAVMVHLALMRQMMKTAMRKRLGPSFLLVRLSWVMLPLSLALGLAAATGFALDRSAPLFGFILVFGWMLSFLLGVLQRILPFLASMHSGLSGGRPLMPSTFTHEGAAMTHARCHCTAVFLVSCGLFFEQGSLVRLGALAGLLGALALLWFALHVWWQSHKALRAAKLVNIS